MGTRKSLLSLSEGSSNHAEHNTHWDESANRPNQLRGDGCNPEARGTSQPRKNNIEKLKLRVYCDSTVYNSIFYSYIVSIDLLFCIWICWMYVCVYIYICIYLYTHVYTERYLSLHTHILSLEHIYCYWVLCLVGTIAITSVIIIFIIGYRALRTIADTHHFLSAFRRITTSAPLRQIKQVCFEGITE